MNVARDYGRGGMVGIGTPQANPTVESEMAILLPPNVARVTARLTSRAEASEDRLCEYLGNLDRALRSFDTLRPDIFGFACTASSYLVAAGQEAETVSSAEQKFGYPVITAAAAMAWKLRTIGARRIALVSPYPPALGAAAAAYWTAQGFELAGSASVAIDDTDTRGIYALGSSDARTQLAGVEALSVDAVLVTGTGMPSLPLIANPPPGAPPIVSSNLALAEAMLDRLGIPLGDWRERCVAATQGSPSCLTR